MPGGGYGRLFLFQRAIAGPCRSTYHQDFSAARRLRRHAWRSIPISDFAKTPVVFSFFRRGKGDAPHTLTPPKPAVPKPTGGVPDRQGASSTTAAPAPPAPADDLDELAYEGATATAESHSAVEEAAILYANERVAEAIAVLAGFIDENPDSRDPKPWLVLFDLYQAQDMKTQFDELSMQFVVRFERSPPVWEGQRRTAAKPAAKKGMASTVTLKGALGPAQAGEIERLATLAQSEGGAKLDLTGASAIDAAAAAQLARVLQDIRRGGRRLTVVGAEGFLALLKEPMQGEARNERAYWSLLFELYQVLNMQAAFEDAAVDYAVAFELSPPSWEPLPETVQVADAESRPREDLAQASQFVIEGVLSSHTDHMLAELRAYAEPREEVWIDMSGAIRVDFVTVGAFISTLDALKQAGKHITISGANEMIHALFEVMGVAEHASLVRRKAR